jgi:hypothetical protein
MDISSVLQLAGLIFMAALLYASVGHAGASGYLAAMALFGMAPAVMKPTALTLNVFVAIIASIKFYRAGCFSGRLFWPLALASVPMAFLGGYLQLPAQFYRPLVGVILLYAAWRLVWRPAREDVVKEERPGLPVLLAGAVIGFLSGLTGVGGGIFLSPLLLFTGWATPRVASGVAAPFILVNSLAGLLGLLGHQPQLPPQIPYWALAAVAGGFLGAEYGSRRLAGPTILKLLAAVLVVAGLKMILS